MAYKDKVEKIIERELWNKATIQDKFYQELLDYGQSTTNMDNVKDSLLFYISDVARYSNSFGSKNIIDLIEMALDIQV